MKNYIMWVIVCLITNLGTYSTMSIKNEEQFIKQNHYMMGLLISQKADAARLQREKDLTGEYEYLRNKGFIPNPLGDSPIYKGK